MTLLKIAMRSIRNYLRWAEPIIALKFWLNNRKILREEWILARVACLGKDVLKILAVDSKVLNIQKGRIDYLLDTFENQKLKTRTLQVQKYFQRQDIVPLMAELESWHWKYFKPPKLVFMDSFSELTDQLFIHRGGKWRFCCNYSDINHTDEFDQNFLGEGLIPKERLEEYYTKFFVRIRQLFGIVPIAFLCFPVKLDTREKFRMQHQEIVSSIHKISTHFPPFHVICVDDALVDWPEKKIPGLEKFPYHFNAGTYQAFADQLRATGLFPS